MRKSAFFRKKCTFPPFRLPGDVKNDYVYRYFGGTGLRGDEMAQKCTFFALLELSWEIRFSRLENIFEFILGIPTLCWANIQTAFHKSNQEYIQNHSRNATIIRIPAGSVVVPEI